MCLRVSSTAMRTAGYTELAHRYLYEQLRDGDWHPMEPLLRQVARWVPPGIALRRVERERVTQRERYVRRRGGDPPSRARQAGEDDRRVMIASGQRRIARDLVKAASQNNTKQRSAYEVKKDQDGVYLMRMVALPWVIRGDQARAVLLRPAFDSLAGTLAAHGLPEMVREAQLTAHEFGFHLATCSPNCSLTARTNEALERMLQEPEGDSP